MDKVPANLPDDVSVIPAANGTEANVFVMFDEVFENGNAWQTRGLTPFEAGELAYALFEAATRAIALAHEAKVNQ